MDQDPIYPEGTKMNVDDFTTDILNEYLNAKMCIHVAEEFKYDLVMKSKRDEYDNQYSICHKDPILAPLHTKMHLMMRIYDFIL